MNTYILITNALNDLTQTIENFLIFIRLLSLNTHVLVSNASINSLKMYIYYFYAIQDYKRYREKERKNILGMNFLQFPWYN